MKNVVWASIRFVWYLNFQCFTLSYKSVVSFYFQCFHSRNIFLLYLYIHIYVCSNIWICIFYSENFNEDTILLIHWTTKCRKKKKIQCDKVCKYPTCLPSYLHTFTNYITVHMIFLGSYNDYTRISSLLFTTTTMSRFKRENIICWHIL